MPVPRALSSRADVAVVASLCAFGAAIRVTGLTSRDLWFDDSWAALPAHVSLHDALRMVVTTPLYTLAMRTWIGVLPQDTWWAQLPALVLGVAGIAAVWALVRAHGYSRLAAFVAAAIVAAGPITVMYATRVKEYPADLLLACLVLWLVDRWRRAPSTRLLTVLAVASIAALWISASTAAVVGGAAATAILVAWSRPEVRRHVAAYLGALFIGAGSVWVVFLRRLPGQLRTNWRTHGFLFGYSSARHVAYEFQQSFAGIAHGLIGIPIAYTFQGFALRAWPMALAVIAVTVLVTLVAPPLVHAIRTMGAGSSPMTASAAAIAIAVLGTLAGLAPFGDGRTDEALYPAILLLGAGAVHSLSTRLAVPALLQRTGRAARSGSAVAVARLLGAASAESYVQSMSTPESLRRTGRATFAGLVAVGAIWFGVTHLAEYPPTGLRTIYAELKPLLRHGDLVVVDGYEQFTWGDEGLTPWRVSFVQGAVPWPMGFHVASEDPSVDLSPEYLQPDPTLAGLVARAARVWFIGPTVGGYSTSAPTDLWPLQDPTPTWRELECPSHLEKPTSTCPVSGLGLQRKTFFEYSGTYAQLYVHPSHRHP
jgi:hypothetical protein